MSSKKKLNTLTLSEKVDVIEAIRNKIKKRISLPNSEFLLY